MNNIWELSNTPDNCKLCASDDPFFIPFTDTDFFALRLQIPYAIVDLEGGGLPYGANFVFSIVDETATNTLLALGNGASNKFNLGARVDTTLKLAEYQIYAPIPFADANGVGHRHKYITVAAGDLVQISGGGYSELFYVSQDSIPYPLYMISATRLGIPVDAATVGTLVVSVNGAPVTPDEVYPTTVGVASEISCFRFNVTITYGGSGNVYEYYTKPFKRVKCNEVVRLEGIYPTATIDCEQHMHTFTVWNYDMFASNMLFATVDADLTEIASMVKKTYGNKCFNFKSEKQRRFSLKSNPMPKWYADEIENISLAKTFLINNVEYYHQEGESIFKDSDIESVSFQNIDVLLTQCKCENVFAC